MLSLPALDEAHIKFLMLALAIFAFFQASFIGYSRSLTQYFNLWIFYPLVLCILSLAFPQSAVFWFNWLFLCFGVLFFIKRSFKKEFSFKSYLEKFKDFDKKDRFLLILLVLYLTSWLVKSFKPHAITDPMIYHVGGPKTWALFLENVTLNKLNPIEFTASYFEYLYYSVFLLLKPSIELAMNSPSLRAEGGLYLPILTGQILHAQFAYVFIPLLTWKLNRKNLFSTTLIIFFIFGMKNFSWIWPAAKNDSLPYFITLYGYYLFNKIDQKGSSSRDVSLTCFLFSFSLFIKLTNLYALIFLFIFLLLENKKTFKEKYFDEKNIVWILGGLLLGAIPYLLRNYIHTGNPTFPTPTGLFPNQHFGDFAIAYMADYSTPSTWGEAFGKLKDLVTNEEIFLPVMLSLLFFKKTRLGTLFLLLSLVTTAKLTGKFAVWRLFTVYCTWFSILMLTFLSNFKHKYRSNFLAGVFVLLAVFSHFQPENIFKIAIYQFKRSALELIEKEEKIKSALEYNKNNFKRGFHLVEEQAPNYFLRWPFYAKREVKEKFSLKEGREFFKQKIKNDN